MDRALQQQMTEAVRALDAGDPARAWALCGDRGPQIRALHDPAERAVRVGQLGIVAAGAGDVFTAVVCHEEARALATALPTAPDDELRAVLCRLSGVCCTLDHH